MRWNARKKKNGGANRIPEQGSTKGQRAYSELGMRSPVKKKKKEPRSGVIKRDHPDVAIQRSRLDTEQISHGHESTRGFVLKKKRGRGGEGSTRRVIPL